MGFLNKEFASSPPSDKHPRQKRKARVEGRGGEIRERTATTVERAASQFNHGDNRNNGFAYHRIYPLRLYIAALRGGALKRTARVQCRANTRDGSTVSLQNDRQDFLQIPCHVPHYLFVYLFSLDLPRLTFNIFDYHYTWINPKKISQYQDKVIYIYV